MEYIRALEIAFLGSQFRSPLYRSIAIKPCRFSGLEISESIKNTFEVPQQLNRLTDIIVRIVSCPKLLAAVHAK
jgi:hypothetical protein